MVSLAKHRSLTFSTCTSISLPILCFDRDESFPLKSTGSLPDLSMIASSTNESKHRTASLNDTNTNNLLTTTSFSITSTHPPLTQPKSSNSNDCSIIFNNSSTMTVSNDSNQGCTALASSVDSNDQNNNCLGNGCMNDQVNKTTEQTSVLNTLKNGSSTLSASESSLLPSSIPDNHHSQLQAVISQIRHRRKSSSLTPVLPNFEMMAKLAAEDQQKEVLLHLKQHKQCEMCSVLGNNCEHNLETNGTMVGEDGINSSEKLNVTVNSCDYGQNYKGHSVVVGDDDDDDNDDHDDHNHNHNEHNNPFGDDDDDNNQWKQYFGK